MKSGELRAKTEIVLPADVWDDLFKRLEIKDRFALEDEPRKNFVVTHFTCYVRGDERKLY